MIYHIFRVFHMEIIHDSHFDLKVRKKFSGS